MPKLHTTRIDQQKTRIRFHKSTSIICVFSVFCSWCWVSIAKWRWRNRSIYKSNAIHLMLVIFVLNMDIIPTNCTCYRTDITKCELFQHTHCEKVIDKWSWKFRSKSPIIIFIRVNHWFPGMMANRHQPCVVWQKIIWTGQKGLVAHGFTAFECHGCQNGSSFFFILITN